jgi:hypothetical protein
VPKIQKPKLKIRKLGRNDIEWSNPSRNQTIHFVDYIKSHNVKNYKYNCKKIGTTFDVGLIICISSTNKGKTQVRWVATIKQRL